jgi:deoxycytidylate deaminase
MEKRQDRHERMFSMLEKLAMSQDPCGNSRHVAAIVYRNEIIAFGFNRKQSHPFQKKFSRHEDAIFLHAENDAILQVIKRYGMDILENCTMYVARMKYDGWQKENMIRGLSKPCLGCSRSLAAHGVKKVLYTCDEVGYDYL